MIAQHILHGEPHQQIIDLATTKQVDLIVMGTQGRSGLERFFMGSVDEPVLGRTLGVARNR